MPGAMPHAKRSPCRTLQAAQSPPFEFTKAALPRKAAESAAGRVMPDRLFAPPTRGHPRISQSPSSNPTFPPRNQPYKGRHGNRDAQGHEGLIERRGKMGSAVSDDLSANNPAKRGNKHKLSFTPPKPVDRSVPPPKPLVQRSLDTRQRNPHLARCKRMPRQRLPLGRLSCSDGIGSAGSHGLYPA